MREVTAIEPKWLSELAPTFFKVADQHTISRRKKNEKSEQPGKESTILVADAFSAWAVQPLFDRYAQNQDEWRLSKLKRAGRSSQTFG